MTSQKYYCLAALSGLAWGCLAYLIGHVAVGNTIWAGVFCSPLIGIIVARTFMPAYNYHSQVQVLASFGSLYLGAVLFGLAVASYDIVFGAPGRKVVELLLQGVLTPMWGDLD